MDVENSLEVILSDIIESEYSPVVPAEDVEFFEHPEKPSHEDINYYKGNVQPVLFQLSNMIMQKAPESDIFNFLGISRAKFNLYKKWFPDFRNAVVQGKCSMNDRMVHALEQAAEGCDYEESEIVNVYVPGIDGEMILVQKKEKITKKKALPNVRAIEMYLTNRDASNWRRSQPDNVTQNNTATVINVSENDLKDFLDTFKRNHLIDTRTNVKETEIVEVVDE